MKRPLLAVMLLALCTMLPRVTPAADQSDTSFGDAHFIAYEGEQSWPRASSTEAIESYAVPIYIGLPTKRYKVLGRIYDPRTTGLDVVGRAFAEGLFPEKDRQRDVANQAKFRGGNAVLVTSDSRILKVLDLTEEEVRKTAPLFEHKDKVVLVIELD
jgi:hypothetical protein